MKLQTRLTVFLVVVVALVVTAISFVNYSEAVRFFMSNQREELDLVSESLVRAAEAIAATDGEAAGLAFLRREDEFRPRITIEVLAQHERAAKHGTLDSESVTDTTSLQREAFLRVRGGQPLTLRFTRTATGLRAFVRQQAWKQLIVGLLATAGASIALGGLLNAYLGAPMRRLAEAAEEAGRGGLNRRVEVLDSGEIGRLGISLNRMLDGIVAARDSEGRQTLERMRLLELLRRNDRERTVDYLAAEFAHELGSPLNVVHGRAEMIREHSSEGDQNYELAGTIIAQVDRMSELIRRRVDRSHQNKQVALRQPVGEVVRRAGHLLEPILNDRQLDLSFEEEPEVVAYFDAEALLQVLTNLILISSRTSLPGTRIDVRLSRIVADSSVPPQVEPGRFALLRVINPQPDPDPTLSVELASRDQGLGLSYRLCEDIVEGLGGFSDFESAPGHGTTFSVFLPKTATNKV